MYNEISTYLDARIAEINNSISGTANDWLKVSLLGEKPESNKLNSYRLLIDVDEENENISAPVFNVTANVELSFLIPNGDVTKYQDLIDTYIHTLVKHIRNNPNYEYSSAWNMNVLKVSAQELGEIVDGVLSPVLILEIQVLDAVTIDTNVPSAPTLTSPANGSTSGTLDQSFQWTGTADSWHIVIYLNSVEVISQEGLDVSSFTVPLDSLLTDATEYEWKVRGKNAGGYGAFSSIRSFTVNDSFTYEPETLAYQTRVLADSGEIIDIDAVNNAILHAKTNGYWNNVKSWVDPQFGVKKSGSAISKLYCLAGFDIIGTNAPTYNATGINSLPSFDFNGTSNYMTVPNVGLGLTSAEVFIAGIRDADPPTAPTSGFWFYGSQSGVDNHVPYTDGNIYDAWGATARKTVGNPASSLASKFLYNISTASGEWTARLNGTQIFTTATNTVGFRTAPLLGKSEGAYYYKGKFGSKLLLNTVATTTQRALINAYFNTKYAIY